MDYLGDQGEDILDIEDSDDDSLSFPAIELKAAEEVKKPRERKRSRGEVHRRW